MSSTKTQESDFPTVDDFLFPTTITSYCAHCRTPDGKLKRCFRCKCVKYCSVECQRKHHFIHRPDCKRVAKINEQLLAEQEDLENKHPDVFLPKWIGEWGSATSNNGLLTTSYCQCKLDLARALVSLAYRSSDTIERGLEIYAKALRHYLELLRIASRDFSGQCVYEAIFILAAIGKYEATYSLLHYAFLRDPVHRERSKPCDWIFGINEDDHKAFDFETHFEQHAGLAETSKAGLLALLLIKLSAGQVVEARCVYRHLDPSKIPQKILECSPLSKENCEELFPTGPEELWFLVQDAFMLTRGVYDVLHDLVYNNDSCVDTESARSKLQEDAPDNG